MTSTRFCSFPTWTVGLIMRVEIVNCTRDRIQGEIQRKKSRGSLNNSTRKISFVLFFFFSKTFFTPQNNTQHKPFVSLKSKRFFERKYSAAVEVWKLHGWWFIVSTNPIHISLRQLATGTASTIKLRKK